MPTIARPASADLLNRLLAIQSRSLPQYLSQSRPWSPRGREAVSQVIENIVADQQSYAKRITTAINERDARPDNGQFPMEITDLHDLSIDYLLSEAIRYQRRDIVEIEEIVTQLGDTRRIDDFAARELAEEVLGSERAHLEALEASVAKPASA